MYSSMLICGNRFSVLLLYNFGHTISYLKNLGSIQDNHCPHCCAALKTMKNMLQFVCHYSSLSYAAFIPGGSRKSFYLLLFNKP